MRKALICIFAAAILAASCSQNGDGKSGQKDTTSEVSPASIPGIDKVAVTDTINLQANDDMHFNNDLFKVKSGKKVILVLKNIGSQVGAPMSHNVVVLAKGTDIASFASVAKMDKGEEYVPSSLATSIIAHTKSVIAGKSESIEFTLAKPGVYDFICSYPGHWGTMQGKIVAE